MLNPDSASDNKFDGKDSDVKARLTLYRDTSQVCSVGIGVRGGREGGD